jgi:hypothetical protein
MSLQDVLRLLGPPAEDAPVDSSFIIPPPEVRFDREWTYKRINATAPAKLVLEFQSGVLVQGYGYQKPYFAERDSPRYRLDRNGVKEYDGFATDFCR